MNIPGISPGLSGTEAGIQKPDGNGSEFFDTLQNTMGQVNQLRTDAETQVGALLRGDGTDVHSAMIAVEKADLAFQLMMQVRNKIVAAYQEIEHMQF